MDKNLGKEQELYINRAIDSVRKKLGKRFAVKFSELLVGFESGDDYLSFTLDIIFHYGNITHLHLIALGWTSDDDVGIETGDDGDLIEITRGNLLESLYFDLALDELDDEFIN